MNILYLNFKVHFLNFIRNKNAFFWAMAFPVFLFLIFYTIFNGFSLEGYATFLLTGVVGMTLTADGLFGVGTIIQQSYSNGTIRYLKKMPMNIFFYFFGMILNRVLILSVLLILLNICSLLLVGECLNISELPPVLLGIMVGMWIFSFLGLCLSFMNIKSDSEQGVKNLVYFFVLFSSNALYEMSAFNPSVEKLANFLPLNGVLNILRSEYTDWLTLGLWITIPPIIFYFLFNKVKYSR